VVDIVSVQRLSPLLGNMSGTLPPLQQLTPDNRGPIVVVVAYIFVTLTVVFTTVRVVTFHTLKRGFGLDDGYLSIAAVKTRIWR
jgi:hypothetical protein